jgi:hypothetical protein
MLDALLTGEGLLGGRPVVICADGVQFHWREMGSVVGEKITLAIEHCIDEAAAADGRLLFRRGANAGRGALADADGQDLGGSGAAGRCRGCPTFR